MKYPLLSLLCVVSVCAMAQIKTAEEKFRQLGTELPTPNTYRTASGAPGHQYWQQRADYDIAVVLDDEKQRISGEETITYYNNSPDALPYLWLQLDQNFQDKESDTYKIATGNFDENVSARQLKGLYRDFDGGFKEVAVTDEKGKALPFLIQKTMMRVDLPTALLPQKSVKFKVKWWFNINNRMEIGGRSGYEYFAEDDNYLYTIAQFFPRMCPYTDVQGWQNKQFLGRGEFALTFGNYTAKITVPSDHILGATGVLQNPSQVLSAAQQKRWAEAQKSTDKPVLIVTEEEARTAEKTKVKKTKTWIWKAENVRDFAFASCRKFIWDAQAVPMGGKTIMAQSFYPKEGNPLWERFSTKAVVQTLKTYSHHTFDYPYPSAISVNAKDIGMEYPMICFNWGRCDKEGKYDDRTRNGMISVIIHEVGHNYFPMIVNSDERQWTWMDEGLNTYLQYLAEQEFEPNYPSRRGPASKIVDYMRSDRATQTPIMANSESLLQFGNNGYAKPATALNILRETVVGRDLFDRAFKTYAQRWMFKSPEPADFFRSIEDASAVDLDWYWRGWFYDTEACDIAIDTVRWLKVGTPKLATKRKIVADSLAVLSKEQPFVPIILNKAELQKVEEELGEREKQILEQGDNYYEITLKNVGGLIMPVILELEYIDGTKEIRRFPAEIWKYNAQKISKILVTQKTVQKIVLDPLLETADIDTSNNSFPSVKQLSRFQKFKQGQK